MRAGFFAEAAARMAAAGKSLGGSHGRLPRMIRAMLPSAFCPALHCQTDALPNLRIFFRSSMICRMAGSDRIEIKSGTSSLLEASVTINSNRYLVLTEPAGNLLITRVYLNGQIISTRKSEFRDADGPGEKAGRALTEAMMRQHKLAITGLKKDLCPDEAEIFLKEALSLLRKGRSRRAFDVLSEGLGHYPGDSFLLSYHGFLMVKLGIGVSEGIEECMKAVQNTMKLPFGAEFFHPPLYLNLGRAYLAAGRKKEAVDAFREGLAADPANRELLSEMKKMGLRKKPAFPFLDRSNPVNKYAGKLKSTLSGGKD